MTIRNDATEYRNALHQLDQIHTGVQQQQQHDLAALNRHGNSAASLTSQADDLHSNVTALAAITKTSPTAASKNSQTSTPPEDNDTLPAIATDLSTAASELEQARYFAHRSPFLPAWRADERNALIYCLGALVAVVGQMFVIRSWSGDGLIDVLVLIGLVLACPTLAFFVSWSAIGFLTRPKLETVEKLPRHPRLGLLFCYGTLLIGCLNAFYSNA